MSSFDILTQLQTKLRMRVEKPELYNKEDLEELFGPGFVSQYPPYTDNPDDDDIDVPDAVDTPYVTHRTFVLPKGKKSGSNYLPLESVVKEQDKEKKDKEEEVPDPEDIDTGAEVPEEPVEGGTEPAPEGGEMEADAETPADMGADASMGGDIGMDAGMGMGEQEEEKSASELGRIYELKKIYTRLTSMESYLEDESDNELSEIRTTISQAIELFEIVSSNFNSYKDKLDEIIVTYYKFILEAYKQVKDYYKKESQIGDY